ncbi:MAG: thioredoxin family protein [Rubrivivax sp.]
MSDTVRMNRWALAGALLWTLCAAGPVPAAVPSTQAAWVTAASSGDVDRAFAQAAERRKPLLLYWGASWCPPCNQLKATLFNRQDFATLTRSFVAVHVDGDRPGAQALGQRFRVGGYPTLVLFRADGQELTRLPGEAEPDQVMDLLRQGLAGGRPVREVLADARAGRALKPDEWRLLAFYSWDTDDEQLSGGATAAERLAELAPAAVRAGASPDTVLRLWLLALAASDDGKGVKADDPLRDLMRRALSDPAQTRLHADVLINRADDVVRALGERPEQRQEFVRLLEPALKRFESDTSLSRADRVSALITRVNLWRIELPRRETRPSLPSSLLSEVRDHAARADREVTDAYERQAVIPSAAYALERAGLWDESESLLLANLPRSHAPYYLMSQLGSLHRKLGRRDQALRWYADAFDRSQGPATRLQWGTSYLQALVELAPADAGRIERVATQLFDEAAKDRGAFHKRSVRSLQRAAKALDGWGRDEARAPALKRLQARLAGLCARVGTADGARDRCRALLPGATAG